MIEHRLEEVLAYADRVLVMENGGILALDAPEKLPSLIRDNDMFQAMPVPMRIFEELSGEGDSPVTVREGREWLEEWREKTSESSCKNQAETVEKCQMTGIENQLKTVGYTGIGNGRYPRERQKNLSSSDYFQKNQQRDLMISSHRLSWKPGTYGSGMKRNSQMWCAT